MFCLKIKVVAGKCNMNSKYSIVTVLFNKEMRLKEQEQVYLQCFLHSISTV